MPVSQFAILRLDRSPGSDRHADCPAQALPKPGAQRIGAPRGAKLSQDLFGSKAVQIA
jgi:hypothetical protein